MFIWGIPYLLRISSTLTGYFEIKLHGRFIDLEKLGGPSLID